LEKGKIFSEVTRIGTSYFTRNLFFLSCFRLSDHDVIKSSIFFRSTEDIVIKMIGEKFAKLEYLKLSLEAMKAEIAIAKLKKYLPGLRGVIKEVKNWDRKTIEF
jgi:hypothetical protein